MPHRSMPLRRLRILWRRHALKEAVAQWKPFKQRLATMVGAVLLGLVALAFAAMADSANHLFLAIVAEWPLAPLILSPLLFALVVWATLRFASEARGSGIPQVIAAGRVRDPAKALRLVSLSTAMKKLGLTVTMLLGGASVGREGPTVQVSAAIMVAMHRWLGVPITQGVLIAGGAAGVAAAFNTPLAGVAFAIEELAAAYEQKIAVLVMAAVMISGLVSLGIAGDYVYFGVITQTLELKTLLIAAPLAGIAGGLAGGLFSRLALGLSGPKSWLPPVLTQRPVLFAALCGLLVAVLGIVTAGATWGTGYAPTRILVEGGEQSMWFGPAKFVATLATMLSNAPGGIFAPSLAIGAGIGNLLKPLFPDDPAGAIVLLGMVGYFVGALRSPFTAVIIIAETTASRGMILPMFATALIADFVSGMVCRERLYGALARRFLPQPNAPAAQPGQTATR